MAGQLHTARMQGRKQMPGRRTLLTLQQLFNGTGRLEGLNRIRTTINARASRAFQQASTSQPTDYQPRNHYW